MCIIRVFPEEKKSCSNASAESYPNFHEYRFNRTEIFRCIYVRYMYVCIYKYMGTYAHAPGKNNLNI